ncbi:MULTISPECIES: DUF5683 domain-containing protein [Spirosoma]|uniref:DUF5683 domain-containing protein n=1 Tax=Spirosoma liriopis TaxID=2937440 RepID=A0ABT0HLJ1_9BACT|nr:MULTISPECIES: DUF5683 domain-containing protein [Spirosoma]MCK8493017.1 DUF5683 domain-containing protein [Spirosoma liriopis]UHG92416.1 DUF5683 domain-containing protein [Spirosoma oryzicola]
MKQQLFLWMAVLLFTTPLLAQRPAIAPAQTPAAVDSTRQGASATDTIPAAVRRNGIRVGNSVLTPESDSASLATDTVQVTAKQEAQIRKIVPRKATIRSLVLPGLGQAYNRQYYKIPFIYAGFGVMGYLFFKYRGLANQAEEGYRLLLYGRTLYITLPDNMVPASIEKPAEIQEKVDQVVIGSQIIQSTTGAKGGYDLYRRYRDMNILLSVALWGLNIVEANVAAHLKTFDLSDDISMRVEPRVLPVPGAGFVPGVRVAFTFK